MSLLSAVHFLRPWWLLALLVLPLLARWWRSQAQRRNPWRDVVDAHLLPHLLEGAANDRVRAWPRWLALCAAGLAIIALAGIYAEIDALEPVKRQGQAVRPKIERYPWPLGLALAVGVLALLLRRRG